MVLLDKVVSQNEAEARYVIGSGEQAMAFLLEKGDGYLFESPITWYSRKQKWDLSLVTSTTTSISRVRQTRLPLLSFQPVRSRRRDRRRYRQPIFLGHGIGCERCHGPGELHVSRPEQMDKDLPNIVNPAKLQPALRESVCQQCHLQGDIRIVGLAGASPTTARGCR